MNAFEAALSLLERTPQRGGPWPGLPPESGVKRPRVMRFPYVLAYSIEGDSVIIVACAHMRRRPGYWRDRPQRLGDR